MQQAPSSDGTALPNANTGQNGDIAANPAVFLNDNVSTQSLTTAALPASRINRIGGTNELHVWAKDAPVSNSNGAGIRDAAVRTNQNVVADVDIVAVIAMEWRFNGAILTNATDGHNTRLRVPIAVCRWLRRGAARHDLPETTLTFLEAGPV